MSGPLLALRYSEEKERLVLLQGGEEVAVRPRSLFPLSDPQGAFVLLDDEGQELAFLPGLGELSAAERAFVERELSLEHFVPRLVSIEHVTSLDFPAVWHVVTDRGRTELSLAGADNIRRLGRFSLLLVDDSGLEVRAPSWNLLERRTRRILERFL